MRSPIKYNVIFCILIISSLLTIVGCSNPFDAGDVASYEFGNPNAEEVLTADPDADIFQYDSLIYQTNIDWVEKLTLTKDEQIGEIKVKNEKDTNFENEMSNKLPVGAKIFTTKEENEMYLLVESAGEIYKYYALVEG